MQKFFDQVDDLHQSNAHMREIIVDFDKKLSLKLNKSALPPLKTELNSNFIPKEYKEIYNKRFDEVT